MDKPVVFVVQVVLFFALTTSYLASTSSADAKSVAAGLFALNGKTTAGPDSTQIEDSIYSGEYVAHTSVFLRDYFNTSSGSPQRDPSSWFQGRSKDSNDIPYWRWTPRDLLVVADYPGQGSGTPASIQVLMWRGGNVSQIFYSDTNAKCNASDPTQFVCAITNDYDNITSPWSFGGKFAQGYTIPARNFFEGGIQLAAMAKVHPCYSGFLATTRVSNQINSVSQDFAYGALKKCGLVLEATCLGGRHHNVSLIPYTIAPYEWNYTISVTNRGYTEVHDIVIMLNNKIIYSIDMLKSLETFTRNNTVGTNTSDVHLVFKAKGSRLYPYTVVDLDNACTNPVPDNSLTPGKKAAITISSVVGAAIVGSAIAGAVIAGYIAMQKMNAAPLLEELTTELNNHGDDGAGVNSLFEDNFTEGTNPMFSAGASV